MSVKVFNVLLTHSTVSSVTTDHLPEMLLAKLQFDRLDAGNRAGFLSFVD